MGAPESARLLGRPPAEWEQTLHAALQLQCDAILMSSNLNVMQQYGIKPHQMASDILQSVFGRHFFPSAAVNDAVPVPRVLHTCTHLAPMGYGPLVPTEWPWWSRTGNYSPRAPVFRIPVLDARPVFRAHPVGNRLISSQTVVCCLSLYICCRLCRTCKLILGYLYYMTPYLNCRSTCIYVAGC